MIQNTFYIDKENARCIAGIFVYVFLIMFLSGCAAPQTKQLALEQPNDLPKQALIENVEFFPQQEFHCGPSTLAMSMNFYEKNVTPTEIAKDVFTPGLKGSLQVEMKAAARAQSMLAYELTPGLVYLLAEVSVGHPVIILQNRSVEWFPKWHYALVIGYNLNRQTIILHSGNNSNYTVSMRTFEHTWNRANNWALVVLPSNTLPNDRNLDNILQAVVDLEEVGQINAANQTYQAIVKRWPESYVATMGIANTYLRMNQPDQATKNYIKAAQLKPHEADIYNNLSYSFLAQSCYSASLNSIHCATTLEPNNPVYQDSLREITALTNSKKQDASNCPIFKCTQ